ncbi:MAG: D-alanyl-alanine synthetase [Proteobacteria bacterium]|nr:D-alanyl-alanine synthetase [Pseudomonadota bacterium]
MSVIALRQKPQTEEKKLARRAGRVLELERQIDRLFRRLRLAVVFGGDKQVEGAVIEPTGNPRSWKSYETVARDIAASMVRAGCKQVSLMPDDMRLGDNLRAQDAHLAWLNTGGVQGHCSVAHAPAMMELFGIPYIGHDPMMAGILDSKHVFKRQLRSAGLPTASFAIVLPEGAGYLPEQDPVFMNAFGEQEGPFIVKPVSGRASLNVLYVQSRADLAAAVDEVYARTRNYVLVEQYLSGAEYCVAIGGPVIARGGRLERLDHPFVFSPLERVLDKDEKIFTSMDLKPISGERARLLNSESDAKVRAELEALAIEVWRQLGIETLVRLDIRADAQGKLHILEANPKPDLKAPEGVVTSLVAMGLAEFGMTYDDLILSIFADRVDTLLSQRRGSADRLVRLV